MNSKVTHIDAGEPVTCDLATLAALLNLRPAGIMARVRAGTLPRPTTRGRYDLAACLRAALRQGEPQDASLLEARRALIVEQRRGLEIENFQRAVALWPIEEVREHLAAHDRIVADVLAAALPRMARRLPPGNTPLLRRELDAVLAAARQQIAKYLDP